MASESLVTKRIRLAAFQRTRAVIRRRTSLKTGLEVREELRRWEELAGSAERAVPAPPPEQALPMAH